MKLNKFYYFWGTVRALLIIAVIALTLFLCIRSHAFNLEMEYTGPGSEASRLESNCREKENRESAERCEKSQGSEKEREKANDYYRDHSA